MFLSAQKLNFLLDRWQVTKNLNKVSICPSPASFLGLAAVSWQRGLCEACYVLIVMVVVFLYGWEPAPKSDTAVTWPEHSSLTSTLTSALVDSEHFFSTNQQIDLFVSVRALTNLAVHVCTLQILATPHNECKFSQGHKVFCSCFC